MIIGKLEEEYNMGENFRKIRILTKNKGLLMTPENIRVCCVSQSANNVPTHYWLVIRPQVTVLCICNFSSLPSMCTTFWHQLCTMCIAVQQLKRIACSWCIMCFNDKRCARIRWGCAQCASHCHILIAAACLMLARSLLHNGQNGPNIMYRTRAQWTVMALLVSKWLLHCFKWS